MQASGDVSQQGHSVGNEGAQIDDFKFGVARIGGLRRERVIMMDVMDELQSIDRGHRD